LIYTQYQNQHPGKSLYAFAQSLEVIAEVDIHQCDRTQWLRKK
jgi:hypothetical protein